MPTSENIKLGENVSISRPDTVDLYECSIGDNSKTGSFVEIQAGAYVGNRCKISSHSFICEGVSIDDEVFIGHGVMFTNDPYPRATTPEGELQTFNDWTTVKTCIKRCASIGSNVTLLPGITIGENAMVGAGAVVTKVAPDYAVVTGVPPRIIGNKLKYSKKIKKYRLIKCNDKCWHNSVWLLGAKLGPKL